MQQKFEVDLLEEAFKYLESLEQKHREKILQNIRRSQFHTDPKLFKKLTGEVWEFRTLYAGLQYRLLAFWDKTDKKETLVLATHGFIKKTAKRIKRKLTGLNEFGKSILKRSNHEKIFIEGSRRQAYRSERNASA